MLLTLFKFHFIIVTDKNSNYMCKKEEKNMCYV